MTALRDFNGSQAICQNKILPALEIFKLKRRLETYKNLSQYVEGRLFFFFFFGIMGYI